MPGKTIRSAKPRPLKPVVAELPRPEDVRIGLSPQDIAASLLDNLRYVQGRFPQYATRNDWYMALAYTVRDRLLDRWMRTMGALSSQVRTICYFSAEFLVGPHLANTMANLGITDNVREACQHLDLNFEELVDQEEEPGLGNGGLGRLAACFLDSLATLDIPAIGYGIRYEFGIFDQEVRDGWQHEITDKWLRYGNPWEITRPEVFHIVQLGGRTCPWYDENGRYRVKWIPHRIVKGVACDTPILGYRTDTADLLRLWKSEACESFNFQAFNHGDYYRAVEDKVVSESISKVLYPNDEPTRGKLLRLTQQYFFVSCSLQDMIRVHLRRSQPIEKFHESFAVQLNDTHPSIAIAELMRLLVDVHMLEWADAWEITRKTFAYTNHTLLPEALEKWSLPLFASLLPRHLQIIYEINKRFLDDVSARYPGDVARLARMSLIDEHDEKYVRMAHLAAVGSHAINGVAALHTDLLKQSIMHDFAEMYPERFFNVTNGVTPRRFMVLSNPRLADLVTRHIGEGWVANLETEIRRIAPFAEDASFREQWRAAKRANKADLARILRQRTNVDVDPDSLFDIQVKRIHEYKRQHLNLLHVVTLYDRLRRNPGLDVPARTFIFGGKAAPGYYMAKLIIKLINSVAEVVNRDPAVDDRLKVVFFPDFNVKNAQGIYPAADLSEQISTAGKEASGTGNMKFAMNGALTIGTLDGANVEIREAVGENNFFLFGHTTDQLRRLREEGYDPRDYYEGNQELRQAIDTIASGLFCPADPGLFRPLLDTLLSHDEFMLMADYASYIACQDRVSQAWRNRDGWTEMSIRNVARMGHFSSDRSIREYAEHIWNVKPLPAE
ncbi:MAG: glycogen/starch/alpha-glucan phosphorylase [Tepidisphaeraceae bacterium]